jgi:hypothetical protein
MIRDKLGLSEGAGIEMRIQGQDLIIRNRKSLPGESGESALKGSRALPDYERKHREEVDQHAKGA